MPKKVRFSSTLRKLVESYSSKKNFCTAVSACILEEEGQHSEEIELRSASLSQYLNGDQKPRFNVLIAMADCLNVSLDYLVFGERPVILDSGYDQAAVSFISQSIAENERKIERQYQSYVSIAHILSDQIREAASKIDIDRPKGSRYIADVMKIEEYSFECLHAAPSLHSDVITGPVIQGHGLFFDTVARNLEQNRRYQFLLPANEDSDAAIRTYKTLLDKRLPGGYGNCDFKTAGNYTFPITGFSLYNIDVMQLDQEEPIIYQEIKDGIYKIGADSWIGYLNPPNKETRLYFSMDKDHVSNALGYFRSLWKKSHRKLEDLLE